MTTETQARELDIGGISIFPVLEIANHRYDETRKEILRVHNRIFMGDSRITDIYPYRRGQPLMGSNTPRALSYEQRARELGIKEFHVLSPLEVLKYWEFLPERDVTCADTNSVVLYPNPSQNSDNEILRKRVLRILGMKRVEGPFTISGLGVHPKDSKDGFNFFETDFTRAEEAPYLERDGGIRYDGEKIVSCNQADEGAIRVLVPEDQSGLRRIYRIRSVGLYASNDNLLNSDDSSRVQILYDPHSRARSLEERV